MAFETLNRLKWTGKLGRCEVIILHRGAPGNKKVIDGAQITGLKRDHFCCGQGGRESLIPLHRVLEIRLDGEVIWKRNTAKG
jgi:uncharacterized protein (UPF0248 family)